MAEKAAKAGLHAKMGTYHPSRRFEEVAINVQTITQRCSAEDIKAVVMIDTLTRFVRAVRLPYKQAETINQCVLDSCISLFCRMEGVFSNRGLSFSGKVVR